MEPLPVTVSGLSDEIRPTCSKETPVDEEENEDDHHWHKDDPNDQPQQISLHHHHRDPAAQLRGETQIWSCWDESRCCFSVTAGRSERRAFTTSSFWLSLQVISVFMVSEPNWLFKIYREFSLSSQEPFKCVWTAFKWTVYYLSLLSLICMNRMKLKLFSQFIRVLRVLAVKLLPATSQRINTKYN